MKYIDAEKLSTQIEKIFPDSSDERTVEGFEYALDKVKAIIDSLQQEQPEQKKNCAECPYCIDRHDQSGWYFKGCFGGPYKGKFIAEIDECPLQQEQPEVECDNETEVQKAYREGKNAGRKEVFDHPEYYGLQLRRMYDYETGKRNPEWGKEDIEEYRNEAKFNPKPGDKFWVRCKSREDSGCWFEKGDERPAYTIDSGNGIQYIVCLDKDGKGNAVSYQNKENFLETFEIIEKQ